MMAMPKMKSTPLNKLDLLKPFFSSSPASKYPELAIQAMPATITTKAVKAIFASIGISLSSKRKAVTVIDPAPRLVADRLAQDTAEEFIRHGLALGFAKRLRDDGI